MAGVGAAAAWAVGADLLQAVRRRVAASRRSLRGMRSPRRWVVPREFDAGFGVSGWFGEEREEAGSSRSSEWKCKKKGKGKGKCKCKSKCNSKSNSKCNGNGNSKSKSKSNGNGNSNSNSNSQYRDPSLRSG